MLALLKVCRERYVPCSIAGGVFHNVGQLCMAAMLLKNAAVFYYLPILLAAGALMGWVTAALLRAVMPALCRIPAFSIPKGKHSGKDG